MSDRIEQMRIELMNDLYAVMGNPDAVQAILNPSDDETVSDATDAAPLYFIEITSQSTGAIKRYDATHLSTDRTRNLFLLATAMQALVATDDDAMRQSIRDMSKAIIDVM